VAGPGNGDGGARPATPPAEPGRSSPSGPEAAGHRPPPQRPGLRLRACVSATEEPVTDGYRLLEPLETGATDELTVDIEVLEIVERQPPLRIPPTRRAPVSLSDYLNRRAH
jgi:hypothetical protein